MSFYRQGDRIGCGMYPLGLSSLKKSGVLARQYCMKCGFRCWIYYGQRYRYIETEVKVDNDQSFYFAVNEARAGGCNSGRMSGRPPNRVE